MGEHEGLALAEHALDRLLVDLPLGLIREQDHDDVRRGGGVVDRHDLVTFLLGPRPGLRALVEPDHHLLPRVLQVQRVRVSLATVADDGDLLALDQSEISVLVVENLRRHVVCSLVCG